MTPEKREAAIRWLTDEIRSLRMAPEINGCGPENWAEQLEVMETCLEAVKGHVVDTDKMVPLTLEQLRGMGGKPYWNVGLQDDSPEPYWKILDPFVARCQEDYGYGKRWLSYAYAPAHIDLIARAEAAEARAEKAENIASDLCDDFTDFVTGGVPNAAPYCANCRKERVDNRGWCNGDNQVCRGFLPKSARVKEE